MLCVGFDLKHTVQVVLKVTHNCKNMKKFTAVGKPIEIMDCVRLLAPKLCSSANALVSNLREQVTTSTEKQGLPNTDSVKTFYYMTTKSLRVS
jgi:hypothetical protein